jgi:hypothetical protein
MEAELNLKDFFAKALLLEDNTVMVINFEITKTNKGKIQLSNSVKLFDKTRVNKLKKVLKIIEEYAIDYYFYPIHDTPAKNGN